MFSLYSQNARVCGCLCVCVCACVRACVRVCVRACVRACVRVFSLSKAIKNQSVSSFSFLFFFSAFLNDSFLHLFYLPPYFPSTLPHSGSSSSSQVSAPLLPSMASSSFLLAIHFSTQIMFSRCPPPTVTSEWQSDEDDVSMGQAKGGNRRRKGCQ